MKKIIVFAGCLLGCSILVGSAQTVRVMSGSTLYDGSPVNILYDYPAPRTATEAAARSKLTAGLKIVYYDVYTMGHTKIETEIFSQGISRGTRNPPSGKLLWTPRILHAQREHCRFLATWYSFNGSTNGDGTANSQVITNVLTTKLFQVVSMHGLPSLSITVPSDIFERLHASRGETFWIYWLSHNVPADAMIAFSLENLDGAPRMEVGISSDTGGYLWTVPPSIDPDTYFLRVHYVTKDGIWGASSEKFPIIIQ